MWARIIFASAIAVGCSAGADEEMEGGAEMGEEAGTDNEDVEDVDEALPLTHFQAKLAGKLLAAGIEEMAGRYGPILPEASAAADCAVLSGDTSDADGDYIPASAKLTFECSAKRMGYSGTLTGVESVTDEQPNNLAWAFTADADLQASLAGPLGGTMVTHASGTVTASQQGLFGPFDLSSEIGMDTLITNLEGTETEVFEDIDWTVSLAPAIDWTPGGPAPAGSLSVDGSWLVSVNERWAQATIETPTALGFSPSCDTLINAGEVVARLSTAGRSGSIRVEWPRCGRRRVSYELE